MARKADYIQDFHDEQAYLFCLLGHTAKELAEDFGVSHQTIKNWFKTYPSFFASVTRGRAYADAKVAEGLYKRATGFSVQGEQLLVVKKSRDEEEIKREAITTYFPPDASAALNWLKNRQPDQWRDKQDVSLTGEISLTMNLDGEPDKDEE